LSRTPLQVTNSWSAEKAPRRRLTRRERSDGFPVRGAHVGVKAAVGLATVYGAIPAELFQGKHFGTIFGTLSSASILGAACGPWLTGWIYDRVGSYTPAFWLAIGLCLVSIACIWQAAPRKQRAVAGQIARLQALRARPGGREG
jgi:nitrate/nitrite transporter NarK